MSSSPPPRSETHVTTGSASVGPGNRTLAPGKNIATSESKQKNGGKRLNHPCIVLKCNCKVPDVPISAHDHGKDIISSDAVRIDRDTTLGKKKLGSVIDVWSEEIRLQLERRGFEVQEAYHNNNTHAFLLSISRKRFQDLDVRYKASHYDTADVEHLDPIKNQPYRLKLAQYALDILQRVTDSNFEFHLKESKLQKHYEKLKTDWDFWIAHDHELLKTNKLESPTSIRDYYGNKAAMYFAFLQYYTFCMLFLSVFATLVFLHMFWDTSENISISLVDSTSWTSWMDQMPVDSRFIPWLALFQAAWGTMFLSLWQSKENETLFSWNENMLELESLSRLGFTSKSRHADSNKKKSGVELRLRVVFSYTVTVIFLVGALLCIFSTFIWEEHLSRTEELLFYGIEIPFKSHLPLVVRALLPSIATPIGAFIFDRCTKFEAQPQLKYEENSLIVKNFLFAFILNFSALFYIALVRKDLVELRSSLIFILTISQILNNLSEWWSGVSSYILEYFKRDTTENITENQLLLKRELSLEEANIDDEFLEMAIQFGMVTMFSLAFPLAPLLCYINNIFEGSVDIIKLNGAKRYSTQLNRARIGVWQEIFEFIGFIAVLINIYLLCFSSENLSEILPENFDRGHWLSFSGRLLIMLLLEHALLGFKYVLKFILYEENTRPKQKEAESIGGITGVDRPSMYVDSSTPGITMPSTPMSQGSSKSTFTQSSKHQNNALLQHLLPGSSDEPNIAKVRKPGHTGTPFFNDPMLFLSAFLIAPLLHAIGASAYLYVPIAILITGFLSVHKAVDVKKKAVALACNDDVIEFLMKEHLPQWVHESAWEKVRWLNQVLQELWPYFGVALSNLLVDILNPILEGVCDSVPVLDQLKITDFDFGTIAPTVNGINPRFHADDQLVRLLLDVSWQSEIKVTLHVKLTGTPVPITIELKDVTISCQVRLELREFTDEGLACFKILAIGFDNKPPPDIQFTLKLASLDVVNMGVGKDYNVTALIDGIIRDVLRDILVHPKFIPIPMYPDADLTSSHTPDGLLLVRLIRAEQVKASDFLTNTSDPYIKIKLSDEDKAHFQRTSVVPKDLNPVWNEEFEFLVFDKDHTYIEMKLYDHDYFSKDDKIGYTKISLSEALETQKAVDNGEKPAIVCPWYHSEGTFIFRQCSFFSLLFFLSFPSCDPFFHSFICIYI